MLKLTQPATIRAAVILLMLSSLVCQLLLLGAIWYLGDAPSQLLRPIVLPRVFVLIGLNIYGLTMYALTVFVQATRNILAMPDERRKALLKLFTDSKAAIPPAFRQAWLMFPFFVVGILMAWVENPRIQLSSLSVFMLGFFVAVTTSWRKMAKLTGANSQTEPPAL